MKKCFITGLVTLLPVAFTIWFIRLVLNLLTKPFTDFLDFLWHPSFPFKQGVSQVLVLLFWFFAALGIGFVARRFFFSHMLHWGDQLLHKVPFISKIYKTSKELIQSLFGENRTPFQQVVLIPFPYPGAYSIGLITGEALNGPDKLSVFIPTVPNPATGYILLSPRSELIFLTITPEEAIKYVLSCGVIQPGSPP